MKATRIKEVRVTENSLLSFIKTMQSLCLLSKRNVQSSGLHMQKDSYLILFVQFNTVRVDLTAPVFHFSLFTVRIVAEE